MKLECIYCHKMRDSTNMARHHRSCKAKKRYDEDKKAKEELRNREDIISQLAMYKERVRNQEKIEKELVKERNMRIEAEKQLSAANMALRMSKERELRGSKVIATIFHNDLFATPWNYRDRGHDEFVKEQIDEWVNSIPNDVTPKDACKKILEKGGELYRKGNQLRMINTDRNRGSGIYKNMDGDWCNDDKFIITDRTVEFIINKVSQIIYNKHYERWIQEGKKDPSEVYGTKKDIKDTKRTIKHKSYSMTNDMRAKETKTLEKDYIQQLGDMTTNT